MNKDFHNYEVWIIVGALIVVGYLAYQAYQSVQSDLNSASNSINAVTSAPSSFFSWLGGLFSSSPS